LTHARQPNLSSALLVLPAGLARMRHRENRRDRAFMLGNSRMKLPHDACWAGKVSSKGSRIRCQCSPCGYINALQETVLTDSM